MWNGNPAKSIELQSSLHLLYLPKIKRWSTYTNFGDKRVTFSFRPDQSFRTGRLSLECQSHNILLNLTFLRHKRQGRWHNSISWHGLKMVYHLHPNQLWNSEGKYPSQIALQFRFQIYVNTKEGNIIEYYELWAIFDRVNDDNLLNNRHCLHSFLYSHSSEINTSKVTLLLTFWYRRSKEICLYQ